MGKFDKVAELEQRRRGALGDQPPTDTLRLALLKYRSVSVFFLAMLILSACMRSSPDFALYNADSPCKEFVILLSSAWPSSTID